MALGNPRGRPSKFRQEVAEAILEKLENGEDINSACRALGATASTFRGWMAADRGNLQGRFERAQALLAMHRLDQIHEIVEAGCRRAEKEIKWREEFAAAWLPAHLQPAWRRPR